MAVAARAVVLGYGVLVVLQLVGFAAGQAASSGVLLQWDAVKSSDQKYTVVVRVTNNQPLTPITIPGWAVSWDWKMSEVIFSVDGGQVLTLTDCSSSPAALLFADQIQYALTCAQRPIIVDNGPRQGYLSAPAVDSVNNTAQFTMSLGKGFNNSLAANLTLPGNFSLGIPGYTCQAPQAAQAGRAVPAALGSRQYYTSIASYDILCVPNITQSLPDCAVSFSAFFNRSLASVTPCVCGCNSTQPAPTAGVVLRSATIQTCTTVGQNAASKLLLGSQRQASPSCDDGCGTDIHIDISLDFGSGWKVTVAVANKQNVEIQPWLLAMDFPLLDYLQTTYSTQYKPVGGSTGAWFGKPYYNDALLASPGNQAWVILFNKTAPSAPFAPPFQGTIDQRAFPTAVTFMGQQCAMPNPNLIPVNPATTPTSSAADVSRHGGWVLAVVLALGVVGVLG